MSFVELGDIMLREVGEDACRKAYGTTDPWGVGYAAVEYGDINGDDGTLN
jgi:hypothetical protein